jgi:glutamate N-acetyltransferase/amino-acid N-acetyltransferase
MKLPHGVRAGGTACGIKRQSDDLGLLAFDQPVSWAGTFTRNAAAAPSVLWSRSRLGAPVRALIVNSGNANACTGAAGTEAVATTVRATAGVLGCSPREVLVSSTGPIGVPLPAYKIVAAVPGLVASLSGDPVPFAQAILTTDSTTKLASATAGEATVVGVAKGAAMLAPNMATMLAFIVTDAAVSEKALQIVLDDAVDVSFNRISVDACESTNDSVYLFSTDAKKVDVESLGAAIRTITKDLAEQIVRDAEGGSRVVRIEVTGARDVNHATALGKAIAASALWRAAVHGGDPNWGRVLAAIGSADRELDPEQVRIEIGKVTVFDSGEPLSTPEKAATEMAGKEISLRCRVGAEQGYSEVLTTDLSPQYVELNAGGTT